MEVAFHAADHFDLWLKANGTECVITWYYKKTPKIACLAKVTN